MHLPRQVGSPAKRPKCKNAHPEYANHKPGEHLAKPKSATNANHVRGACFLIWFAFLGFAIRPSGHCFATNPIGFRIGPERWGDVVPYLVHGIKAPLWLCGHQQLTASDRSGPSETQGPCPEAKGFLYQSPYHNLPTTLAERKTKPGIGSKLVHAGLFSVARGYVRRS